MINHLKGVIILKDYNRNMLDSMIVSIDKNMNWLKELFIIVDGSEFQLDLNNLKNLKVTIIDFQERCNPKTNYTIKQKELLLYKLIDIKEDILYFPKICTVTKKVHLKEIYYKNYPKYFSIIQPLSFGNTYDRNDELTMLYNCSLINSYFEVPLSIKKNFLKWININYKIKNIKNIKMLFWRKIVGFVLDDTPQIISYKIYNELWRILSDELIYQTEKKDDVNSPDFRLFIYWGILKGQYYPKSLNTIKKFRSSDKYDNI